MAWTSDQEVTASGVRVEGTAQDEGKIVMGDLWIGTG